MEKELSKDGKKGRTGLLMQIVVVLLILLIPILIYLIQQHTRISPPINKPRGSSGNQQVVYDPTCNGQKQKYAALLETESVVDGITVGSFKGIVQHVSYNPVSKKANLILTSEDGTGSYDLSITDGTVRIANTIKHTYETSLTALAADQHVELSYNCDPQNGNLFTLVSVSINP